MNLSGALDQTALSVAITLNDKLPVLGARQALHNLYLHWRVSGYAGACSEYNALVSLRADANAWQTLIQTDPRLNATEPVQPGYAAHTYLRNSHAFGLSVDAMEQATPSNFGPAPITQHEIETLCASAAAVCLKYNIDASNPATLMTHGEAAILDAYFITDQTSDGVTRWDLARLEASANPLTKEECIATGNVLRNRIHLYKIALMSEKKA